MLRVSYAVDIGVYNLGANKNTLSSTKTAWARSVNGVSSFEEIYHQGSCEEASFRNVDENAWSCGRNIGQLVEKIAADIGAGLLVSLGFEAPMWFPISREECANLRLFKFRFDAERGSEWYLQSGAAATLKAASIGVMLLGLLAAKRPGIRLTTSPSSAANDAIILYEAFVAGKFKTPPPLGATQAENEWDALTASLAWGAVNSGFIVPSALRAQELHKAGSSTGDVASVWQIAAALLPSRPVVDGPPDCQIIGISKNGPAD